MDYTLAKALKDAGFIFNGKRKLMGRYDKVYKQSTTEMLSGDYELVPSLGELVAACGDIALRLERWPTGTKWEAQCCDRKQHLVFGPTPSIALARLWISLQEKK